VSVVNDTTVEKLGELLNHHPNGLLLFRDELSGWFHTMDRPGHENDRAFYCEAWNGTSAYTYDRIGRGTVHIRAACLSVLGSAALEVSCECCGRPTPASSMVEVEAVQTAHLAGSRRCADWAHRNAHL